MKSSKGCCFRSSDWSQMDLQHIHTLSSESSSIAPADDLSNRGAFEEKSLRHLL